LSGAKTSVAMKINISSNEIKKVRALQQKKFRDETGLFLVEGEKMVEEALSSSFKVEKLYRKNGVGDDAMKRMSAFSNPSPVLAVVHKPDDIYIDDMTHIDKLIENKGLFIALDSIRDPGNLGTILRIADWFGIEAVFATHDTVDVFNPKVVQATMGAVFRVKMHYLDIQKVARNILDAGGKVYGTFLDGNDMYHAEIETGNNAPVMVVIGNESEGISSKMEALVSDKLYIPPYPSDSKGSESLNAAVATAVTIAEFRRRLMA